MYTFDLHPHCSAVIEFAPQKTGYIYKKLNRFRDVRQQRFPFSGRLPTGAVEYVEYSTTSTHDVLFHWETSRQNHAI
jgi:hypothetical protein